MSQWRRWSTAAIILGFVGWGTYSELVMAPIATQMRNDLNEAIRALDLPRGVALGTCEESSGPGKAYVGCTYTGSIDARALETHYAKAFQSLGWLPCTGGASNDSANAWRSYCRQSWRAVLYRQAGAEVNSYGLSISWPG